MLVTQFQDKSCFMTSLEDFQRDPSTAQPYLVFTMYDELAAEKGMVLVRADICHMSLSTADAEKLTNQLIRHYTTEVHTTCWFASIRVMVSPGAVQVGREV